MQEMKFVMDNLEDILGPWKTFYTIGAEHILIKIETLVRGSLPSQFLVILGQVGDLNGHVLGKKEGKILG